MLRMLLVRRFATLPAHVRVAMPALSPTMTTGTIARWLKKEGDVLAPGDALAEVETDKATVTFECQDDAVLARILKGDGSADVAVGDIIAITVDSPADVAAFASMKAEDVAKPAAPAAPAASAAPAAPKPAAPAAPKPAAPAAPAPAAPTPAPKPAATASVAAAAPAPAAAPAAGDAYVAFEAWGSGLARSPLSQAIARAQQAYTAAYGYTGFDPLPLAEEGDKKKKA